MISGENLLLGIGFWDNMHWLRLGFGQRGGGYPQHRVAGSLLSMVW
jgi:hypothetical protein